MMFAAGTAMAEKVPGSVTGNGFIPTGDCPTDGYKDYTGSGADIPDNAPGGGLVVGPINAPDDGSTFTDVIVDLELAHTWVGDLNVDVSYDLECDGQADATARIICRPLQSDCDPAGTTFGCSDDLAGTYRFSDDGAGDLGAACGAGVFPAGCYAPSPGGSLSVFDGLAKGGCFTVYAEDNAAGDTGSVGAVVIWTLNDGGGTPTESVSWGDVKSRF
jgi:hypothetical protein